MKKTRFVASLKTGLIALACFCAVAPTRAIATSPGNETEDSKMRAYCEQLHTQKEVEFPVFAEQQKKNAKRLVNVAARAHSNYFFRNINLNLDSNRKQCQRVISAMRKERARLEFNPDDEKVRYSSPVLDSLSQPYLNLKSELRMLISSSRLGTIKESQPEYHFSFFSYDENYFSTKTGVYFQVCSRYEGDVLRAIPVITLCQVLNLETGEQTTSRNEVQLTPDMSTYIDQSTSWNTQKACKKFWEK